MPESALAAIAESFVHARLMANALAGFPGEVPPDLATGYAIQDRAIKAWPDELVGWKIGYIAPARRDHSNDERLVGPIFRRQVRFAQAGAEVEFPVFEGGFAAVEAEFAFRIARDVPPDQFAWSAAEAMDAADALHVAVETAGSPLATINVLGPAVVVSDFGNNAGLIVGPAVRDWRVRGFDSMQCETLIEERSVGRGSAASLIGGPAGALAFALGRCARRGHAMKAGMWVTTGAATGIHDIRAGERSRVRFLGDADLFCRAVPARAAALSSHAAGGLSC